MDTKAAFENWFAERYTSQDFWNENIPALDKRNIKYAAWNGWKESRASLSISAYDFEWFSPHDSGEQAVWITEVIRTLRKAGITVPEELNAYGIRIKGKTE